MINYDESVAQSEDESHFIQSAHEDQLNEQINSLEKENKILRSQFEQALLVSNKVHEVHQNSEDLKQELRRCQANNDDLVKRLSISEQNTVDLQNKLSEELLATQTMRKSEHEYTKKEIDLVKEQYQQQTENLYNQIDKLRESRNKVEIDKKKAQSQVEKLLQIASVHFNKDVQEVDDLVVLLNEEPQAEPVQAIPNKSEKEVELQAALKKEKKKVKNLTAGFIELENKLQKSEKQNSDVEKRFQKELQQIQSVAEKKVKEADIKETEIKNHTDFLIEKLRKTEDELARTKSALSGIESQVKKEQQEKTREARTRALEQGISQRGSVIENLQVSQVPDKNATVEDEEVKNELQKKNSQLN